MVEALAALFAGYAAYAGWPWWWATLAGGLSGFQVALARAYRSGAAQRVQAGDPTVSRELAKMAVIGLALGALGATLIYFIARAFFV